MRPLPAGYFGGEPFAPAATGELFRHYTCIACGARLKTWAAFRAHRPECSGHLWTVPQMPPPQTDADLDALAALYDQLHQEEAS